MVDMAGSVDGRKMVDMAGSVDGGHGGVGR